MAGNLIGVFSDISASLAFRLGYVTMSQKLKPPLHLVDNDKIDHVERLEI